MEETAIEKTSLESQIENSLVKQNVTEAVINSLKEKYKDLKLRSLDDKEKYLEIKDAAKEVGKVRILATKICKAGREDAVKIQKLWVAKEKEVVGKIAEVENPLDAEISTYDNEVNRKKEELKRQQEQAYMERTQALTKMGALYHDNSFELGETSIEANLVKESSEEVWIEEILPKFREEFEKAEAERLEIEKQKAAHEAELKRQQEELLKKQREFEAQQAEFKKQQEESARIEREKIQSEEREKQKAIDELRSKRIQQLAPYSNGAVMDGDIWKLSEEDFNSLLSTTKENWTKRHEEEVKKIAEQAAQKERERLDRERALEEEQRKQDEIKKAEELAKAGDKAIWMDFIKKVEAIHYPKLKSGQYKRVGNIAIEKLNEIINLKPY